MELRKEMLRKKKEQVTAEGKDVQTLLKEAKLSQKQKVRSFLLSMYLFIFIFLNVPSNRIFVKIRAYLILE